MSTRRGLFTLTNVTPVISPNIAASMENSEEVTCSCPRRQPTPLPVPTTLPPGLKATEEHVESLKEWLLYYYGATKFYVCEHQPLLLMKCELLQIYVDPNARPVAVHKPALVQMYSQDKVNADLGRDVRIGAQERISQNTPTTWCSRVVVTSKAEGTPRQTIDLQPQNRHSEGVCLFDPARMTCLATDWSVDGIGFFLMQKYCQCSSNTYCYDGWKSCLVGSRFTHPAESRYAPIEEDCKELPTDLRPYHRFASIGRSYRPSNFYTSSSSETSTQLTPRSTPRSQLTACKSHVYWPKITEDIARVRNQCVRCHQTLCSHHLTTSLDYPFQMICSDYFTYNSIYYVDIVDRNSNWLMVYKSESSAEGLVKRLRESFVTFGIPEELSPMEVNSSQKGTLESF
ncbi:unnamed protein product [Mytilus coruscus]|uniref:Uncharacterized protein n=1 Tax=Mytilus coruscus TaxID=42192 RepID=A0A6J8CRA7_MYTCO|nr:unnamed protein product [Mytilus coruscus]